MKKPNKIGLIVMSLSTLVIYLNGWVYLYTLTNPPETFWAETMQTLAVFFILGLSMISTLFIVFNPRPTHYKKIQHGLYGLQLIAFGVTIVLVFFRGI